MKLIEQLNNLRGRELVPIDMQAYTHQDDMITAILHHIVALTLNRPINVEETLHTGMAIIVLAIRTAGELPEDLDDIPVMGQGNEIARRLIASVPERCPDCDGEKHQGGCGEPDYYPKSREEPYD